MKYLLYRINTCRLNENKDFKVIKIEFSNFYIECSQANLKSISSKRKHFTKEIYFH